VTDTAVAHRDAVALKLDDLEVGYAQLDEASGCVAGVLERKGVAPGDRVSACCRTSRTSPSCTTGCCGRHRRRADDPLLKEREVAFYLGDPEAKLFFAWHQFADAAHAGAEAAGAECVLVEPGNFESLIGRGSRGETSSNARVTTPP
jgi:long-chain acyl-CoA synthetase